MKNVMRDESGRRLLLKRGLFFLLLLTMLALPAFALCLDWAEYVAQVDAALLGQSGEVVLEIPPQVEPFLLDEATGLPQDALLVVPEGVSLRLTGGELPGLLLGGGELTLENTRVTGVEGAPSVYIMQQRREKQPLRLSLTLAEGTVLESAHSSALGVMPEPLAAWTVSIENRGAVRALSDAPAMDLDFQGEHTLSLSLRNTGEISGSQGIRLELHPHGAYWCLVENDGEIAGESAGLSLGLSGRQRSDYLSVINGAQGVIRCGDAGEAALAFRADSKQGTVQVVNHGLLAGESSAIAFTCNRDKLLPVEVINDGVLTCADADAAPLSLAVMQRVENAKEILNEEGLRRELKPFLEASAFDSLSKGTKLRASVHAVLDGEILPAVSEATFESVQLVRPAIAWRDFLRQLKTVLALAHGDVLYHPTQRVLAFQHGDIPLVAPEGTHLTIVGGAFESMLLGSGSITLEGTLVEMVEDGQAALLIERKNEPLQLALVLDENTHIANYGLNGIGLGAGNAFYKEISLDVTNHGVIECMMGEAVAVRLTADGKHPATLSFHNHGSILGDTLGLSLGVETHQGEASVLFWNAGTVETREGAGLSVAVSSYDALLLASLENTRDGSIRSEKGGGLQVDLRESTGTLASYDSEGWIINDGRIEGAHIALSLSTPPQRPVQMMLRVRGDLSSDADAPEVLVRFEQRLDRKHPVALDGDTFQANRETFLDSLGIRYLPENIRISSHLLIQDSTSAGEPLYAQTTQGGGETLPDRMAP